jgi:hypothetical protein
VDKGLEQGLDDATAEAEYEVEGGFLLDVVDDEGVVIL